MRDDIRFDVCPICKEKKWLYFTIGSYKLNGEQVWAKFICKECYDMLKDITRGDVNERQEGE